MSQIKELQLRLAEFAKERDWEQFHTPKNLTMALSGEVGELTEIFQWLTDKQSFNLNNKQTSALNEELADVFLYLIRLADVTGVDLLKASEEKLQKNALKHPIEKCFGNAKKYTEFK